MTTDDPENIKMLNSFISKIDRPLQPQHKNRTGLQYLWNIKKKSITASEIFDLKRRSTPTSAWKRAGLAVDNYSHLKELKIIYAQKHHWNMKVTPRHIRHISLQSRETNPLTTSKPKGTNADMSLLLARKQACLTGTWRTNAGATATNDHINDSI